MHKKLFNMKDQRAKSEIPPEGLQTTHGYLYNPPKLSKQILSLLASFFGAIFLGWVVSSIPGGLSDFAKGFFYIPYILVFFLGYAAWISWLNVIVFDTIKWPLLKTLFGFLLRKEKPESIQSLMPSKEKVIEIMVRAQKATRTFSLLSWPIGIACGLAVMFVSSSANPVFIFFLVSLSSVAFGYTLSYFGRRGYFPFPEE